MNPLSLHKLSYGLYIVSSLEDGKMNGYIGNTVFQICADPVIVAVSVNKNNLTREFIQKSGLVGISVLTEQATMELIGRFGFKSGREVNKFEGIEYGRGRTGIPYLKKYTSAYLEGKVRDVQDVYTHSLYTVEITGGEILDPEAKPMTYEYYHRVKNGKSPKNAPTFIKENNKENIMTGGSSMQEYECSVCGYIYDPVVGDPDNGIPPNTPFEDLPAEWVCPVCGVGKSEFGPVK